MIEVAVCLVILGLMAGLAALSLRGMRTNMDLEAWVEQLALLDRQTRQRAESQGRLWRIVVDLEREVLWAEPVKKSVEEEPRTMLGVPRGWRLAEAMSSDESAAFFSGNNSGGGGRVRGGQVTVICSGAGVVPGAKVVPGVGAIPGAGVG